ncbi:MAG: manganese transporter, partial [Planctomycetota bacterium]
MKPDCLPIGQLTAILLGCLWISGCGQSGPRSDGRPGDPVVVVCTTGQVADMLRNIGREHVRVESLMGPG